MKIHVPSMLVIGIDKHTQQTHTTNKQAATMASLNIRAATLTVTCTYTTTYIHTYMYCNTLTFYSNIKLMY